MAVLVVAGCVAHDGVRGSGDVRQYEDQSFSDIRVAVYESLRRSGFALDNAGYDGAHIYIIRGIQDAGGARIEVGGSRNRSYRSSIVVRIERLDVGNVRVTMSNPASRANYGGGQSNRPHRQFLEELDRQLETG